MIFLDRGRKGDDPRLGWKVRLFLIGAVVALLGMARGSSWLVLGGMLILLVGASLRFLPGGRVAEPPPESEEDDDEPPEDGDARAS
jgi:hypothetical protein